MYFYKVDRFSYIYTKFSIQFVKTFSKINKKK
nr:MAG TPA: hypothetical protein [Caudoviricetes sp.]